MTTLIEAVYENGVLKPLVEAGFKDDRDPVAEALAEMRRERDRHSNLTTRLTLSG